MTHFSTLPPIILASKSPRRKQILSKAGFNFQVITADTEEVTLRTASKTVQANAKLKCEEVASQYPDKLVIAADTVVSLNERILEKPHSLKEAKQMLLSLSGQKHQVFSAVTLIYKDKTIDESFMEISDVYFKELSIDLVDAYLTKVDPLDKAGSYNIDEYGELIIEKIVGEYENIMGLPISTLVQKLTKLNLF